MLQLFNTLTRKLEEFIPFEEGKVKFYHCGPTVYWTQHIGNLRGMTMGDLVVRTLRFLGYKVTHVRNYTDVGHLTSDADSGEDKMDKGAKRESQTPEQIAQKYIQIFENDTQALNLVEPNYKPRPSELIPEIINMVQTLLDKGYAYTTDLAVYFDVSKFTPYTTLSGQKLEMNIKGAGKGEVEDRGKKYFADFALWVFKAGSHANALQTWSSPFTSAQVKEGRGFPGWHIECSVMAQKFLGPTLDLHMGGVEHIPVHHTNEIAQSEAANNTQFVRYFLHNEWLVAGGTKMAKSQGTGLTLVDVTKRGFSPLALRYFYLTAHYRSRQNFSWEALQDAQSSLAALRSQISSIKYQISKKSRNQLSAEKLNKLDVLRDKFRQSLENDFNIPQALAVAWETIKSNLPSIDKYDLLLVFDQVLGLKINEAGLKIPKVRVPEQIQELLNKRNELRAAKQYTKADLVRAQIEKLGYTVKDSPRGSQLK